MKRISYAVVCDLQFEDGLNDVDKVIYLKNLGSNICTLLDSQISCIMGVANRIEETYGLSYDEILEVLQEIYGYIIIKKSEMIEPNKYCVFDTFYNWELYAQKEEYALECDKLEVNGLEDLLKEIIHRTID